MEKVEALAAIKEAWQDGDLDLGDAESETAKKETEDIAKKNDDLIKDIKETLGDKVADVKVSQRLKTSAVCLVADETVHELFGARAAAALRSAGFSPLLFSGRDIREQKLRRRFAK